MDNKILTTLAAIGLAAGYAEKGNGLRPEDIDVRPKKLPPPKGHKRFIIEGKEVWALNRKNAIKKASKN